MHVKISEMDTSATTKNIYNNNDQKLLFRQLVDEKFVNHGSYITKIKKDTTKIYEDVGIHSAESIKILKSRI